MLSEQIRRLARDCAEEALRRHRHHGESIPERPGPAEWEALRDLLGVAGEPAPGTAEHERFRLAEELFVETFRARLRSNAEE